MGFGHALDPDGLNVVGSHDQPRAWWNRTQLQGDRVQLRAYKKEVAMLGREDLFQRGNHVGVDPGGEGRDVCVECRAPNRHLPLAQPGQQPRLGWEAQSMPGHHFRRSLGDRLRIIKRGQVVLQGVGPTILLGIGYRDELQAARLQQFAKEVEVPDLSTREAWVLGPDEGGEHASVPLGAGQDLIGTRLSRRGGWQLGDSGRREFAPLGVMLLEPCFGVPQSGQRHKADQHGLQPESGTPSAAKSPSPQVASQV